MIQDIKDIFVTADVYSIYSACMHKPSYEKFKTKSFSFQNDDTISIYGYFFDTTIVGIIVVQEKERSIEIIGISVNDKNRKSGIGTKLINYIRKNTTKQITAETDSDAVGFYKKYGFNISEHTVSKSGETYTRYLCYLN